MPDEDKAGSKLIRGFFHTFFYLGLYLLSISSVAMLWGFYRDANGAIGYSFDWGRSIWFVISLIGIGVIYAFRATFRAQGTFDVIAKPVFLHTLGTITFIVSIFSSVFSADILMGLDSTLKREGLDALPEMAIALVPFSEHFVWFTAAVLMLLPLFVLHGVEAYKVREAQMEAQSKQAKELRDAIRVAPPPYFTSMLADMSDQAEDFLNSMGHDISAMNKKAFGNELNKADKLAMLNDQIDKQRRTMRAVLVAFGELARIYDSVNPADTSVSIQYKANLMLNLEPNGNAFKYLYPDKLPEIRFELPFDAKPSFFLMITKELSVNINKGFKTLFKEDKSDVGTANKRIEPNKFAKDNTVIPAILPIYWKADEDKYKNYSMIGAPMAIASGKNEFIPDTVLAIKNSTNYPDDIHQKAITYFDNDKKGRSIVSLPVATRHFKQSKNEKTAPKTYLGVINVYRNEPDIFSGHTKNFKFFADFTRPLNLVMARMAEYHIYTLALAQTIKTGKDGTFDLSR